MVQLRLFAACEEGFSRTKSDRCEEGFSEAKSDVGADSAAAKGADCWIGRFTGVKDGTGGAGCWISF